MRLTNFPMILALVFGLTIINAPLSAQVNDKGTIHAAIGASLGVHATEYQQTLSIFGIPVTATETDGAVTATFPIQVGYGFAKVFSLGLLIEPGSYLDSNATRSNGVFSFALEPRFYIINGDRFAWTAGLQFGGTSLRIENAEANDRAVYTGGNFGLSSGVGFYFTEHIGLDLGLRYLATRLPLKEYSVNGSSVSLENFDAELRTSGVTLQASLAFKF